jgi:hypothetical protein
MTGIRRVSQLGTTGESTYVDGSIQTVDIADGAVGTADIAANAVTQAKLSTDIPLSGFRNIVINGGFDIWQRGTSVAIQSASSSAAYQADRWATYRAVAGSTQSQIASGLSGFQNAIRLQRNSGNTATNPIYLSQSFETSAISKVAGLPVVVSFYARVGSNFTGSTILARMGVGTGTERDVIWSGGWTSYTEPLSQQVTPTTNWQRFVLYVTVPAGTTQAGLFFTVSPTGTASTNDYVDITGVQIEAGSQVTPFEQRPIGIELHLCMRYYQNYPYGQYQEMPVAIGYAPANYYYGAQNMRVPFRAAPTVTLSSVQWRTPGTANLSAGSSAYYVAHNDGAYFAFAAASGGYHALSFFISSTQTAEL